MATFDPQCAEVLRRVAAWGASARPTVVSPLLTAARTAHDDIGAAIRAHAGATA